MPRTTQARRPARRVAASCGALALLALAGCPKPDTDKTIRESRQERTTDERVAELQRELAGRDEMLRAQAAQIQQLQQMGSERLALIPHAARIELDALTGGYDADGIAGDEGIVAYVRPYDADGDEIKAAGVLTVQVLDLSGGGGGQVVAEAVLEGEALRKSWYARFITAHYTLRVPWRGGPPARSELAVRAQFVDLVSGMSFEALRPVSVTLPANPTTRPH